MPLSSLFAHFRNFRKPRSRRQGCPRIYSTASAEILEHRQLLTAQITDIGDLNTAQEVAGSDPQELTQIGTTLYFTAADKTHGRELWKKEGANPAVLVKDIAPGTASSGVSELTAVGNTLFFRADDGPHGPELWKSDGTSAGTVWVKDIVDPGNPNTTNLALGPKELIAVNGKLFFRAYPELGNPNPTLMVSDGTAAGTRMVTDTFLNTPLHNGIYMAQLGSKLLFDAYGLHVTDGTSAGTQYLAGEYGNFPLETTTVGGIAFFGLSGELWKTDGTVAGTVMVKDINPSGSSNPSGLTNINGVLYFSANDGTNGIELWKSDGTAAGTVLVKAIYPGATNNSFPGNFTLVGNTLYFTANDGVNGFDIWKSDGTAAGTVRVGHNGTSPNFSPSNLTNVNGALYFTALTNEAGLELWKSDGTLAGTSVYRDINPGTAWSGVSNLSNINGSLYYTAADGVKGNELWRHDVVTNTAIIDDVNRGTRSSNAHDFVTAGNNVYFVTTIQKVDGTVEREELWKSALNGTGKTLLRTVQPSVLGNTWGFQSLTNFQGNLYFTAFESNIGTELWKSDGTVAGTVRLKDINQTSVGGGESWPSSLTVAGNTLFFSALDGNGRELWKTDGTGAGTMMVRDITAGAGATIDQAAPFTAIGSTVYFIANDGVSGFELWKSDGTSAGTTLVKDINPGAASAVPHLPQYGFPVQIMSVGNLVYLVADDGVNGFELWQSDGTTAGTSMVADLQAGAAHTFITSLTNANGKLYFEYAAMAPSGAPLGRVLACRPTPTSPLTSVNQNDDGGFRNGTVQPLAALGGDVYFTRPDAELGTELWKSDGTAAGTVMVKDIFQYPKSTSNAQTYSSDPQQIVATNGMVYFSAYTPANGRELWMSDGTASGTVLLADLTGDPGSSNPVSLMASNGRVYLSAVTEATGREPFTVIDVFTPTAPSITAPVAVTPAQRPTITWTASTGAVSYDVFIKNNATGANPQVSVNVVGATSYVPTADLGIGKFTVWVRAVSASGTKSNWSAQRDFTINTAAAPNATMRNQQTSRPKVTWGDLAGAVKFDVWLDSTTAGQTSTVILHDIRGKSWQTTTDLALGSYRVWVRGLDASGLAAAWSPVVHFNVATSPSMTAPLSSTFERRPQFTWNAVPSATKYDIYIRNMDSETVAFSQANITATTWTPPSDLANGHYRWQVVAASPNARGLWSNPTDFTIGGQPEILTPTGSTTNNKPTISWKAVGGAATYQVWVDRADTWVPAVINVSGITATSYTPATSLAAGTYRVWVRAISASGQLSAWSDFQTFQVTT